MTYNDRDEGEIKRRAAWLLGMLALVAALIVVLMVFFLHSGSGSSPDANPNPNYGNNPSTSRSHSSGTPHSAHPGSGSSTASTGQPSGQTTPAGPVPTASCPTSTACSVQGDISGAVTAIDKLRAKHGLGPVQATITHSAEQCALSSGSTCPQSFVWVHVTDLSGQAVVTAVEGFSGTDNLLDPGAKQFAIGWAYDPGSHSSSAAVIRVS